MGWKKILLNIILMFHQSIFPECRYSSVCLKFWKRHTKQNLNSVAIAFSGLVVSNRTCQQVLRIPDPHSDSGCVTPFRCGHSWNGTAKINIILCLKKMSHPMRACCWQCCLFSSWNLKYIINRVKLTKLNCCRCCNY